MRSYFMRSYFLQSPPTVTEPSLHSVMMRSSGRVTFGDEGAGEEDGM